MKASIAINNPASNSRVLTLISKREKEVLELISLGLNSKQISSRLFISDHTVISHRKNLYKKLDATNGAGLVRNAFEHGFLTI